MIINSHDNNRGQAARTGRDRAEFEGHYRLYANAVYSVARDLCGVGVAADVTRDVFLDLWGHREEYLQAHASIRASLLRSTYRLAVGTVRSASGGTQGTHASDHPGCGAVSDGASIDERVAFGQPLDGLCREERTAIVLVTRGGCTYREAAVALGLDECTMKRTIRAGLQHLKGVNRGDASTADACDDVVADVPIRPWFRAGA